MSLARREADRLEVFLWLSGLVQHRTAQLAFTKCFLLLAMNAITYVQEEILKR